MARVKTGPMSRKRHKKILKLARGYRNAHSKLFRTAHQAVMKALSYAYAHRKKKKGDFRKIWITRINAAARMNGISYSTMMNGLKKAGVAVNRKMLADLAVNDMAAFAKLVDVAKAKVNA
ncbi:50S ribosomal protein L20 [Heliobacterium gestii]|uniref:Large ribosomal subunit protein bL20 n=1 Tax=Heliomicrobium gestii TaxID=2699 RepID=A0A845L8C6_HELGE|nr:50S ribosomal protein L20 [Heliomicrobium gestii]MBM7866206.1 large subunit ribosomal protein L20 [Heliomicrobium gestii]MZP42468.1 50S ribosomal protein L20 [Heliomicrobium gestii]